MAAQDVQIELQENASGYGSAGVHLDASATSTIYARLDDVTGLQTISWEIFGTHSSAVSAPAVTLSGNPAGEIASFVLPSGAGQAYGIRAYITDDSGASATPENAVYVVYANGYAPMFAGETTHRNATHGRLADLNATIAALP